GVAAAGSAKIWTMQAAVNNSALKDYVFNNVMVNNVAGNDIDVCQLGTNCGTHYFFNNSFQFGKDAAVGASITLGSTSPNTGPLTTIYVLNDHCITSSTTCLNVNAGGNNVTVAANSNNLAQSVATANGQGYTSSGNAWQPTAGTGGTVNTGANEQSLCSAILSVNVPAATACTNATGYACSYNTSNHTVSCPALALTPRPTSASWNIGAYQFTAGPIASFSPSPLAFGSVNLGSNSSQTVTLTNVGNANMVLGTPYVQPLTGTNVADFSITGTTCSNGQTITPSNSCTITVKFIPSVAGPESAVLTINGNAVGTVTLTGNGVAVSASMII